MLHRCRCRGCCRLGSCHRSQQQRPRDWNPKVTAGKMCPTGIRHKPWFENVKTAAGRAGNTSQIYIVCMYIYIINNWLKNTTDPKKRKIEKKTKKNMNFGSSWDGIVGRWVRTWTPLGRGQSGGSRAGWCRCRDWTWADEPLSLWSPDATVVGAWNGVGL